jgi:hypothetical protein
MIMRALLRSGRHFPIWRCSFEIEGYRRRMDDYIST